MSVDKYKNLKVKELQELLQKNNLPHSGKKEELIERLVKFDEQQEDALDEFGDLLDDNTDPDKTIDLSTEIEEFEALDDKETAEEKPSETEKEDITPVSKPNSSFQYTPITFGKAEDTSAKTKAEETSDADKALERAKRFGIQVNESTKKDIRAQRFGIENKQSTEKKGVDEDVLKKRAERFGLSKTTENGDSEAMKKRAARFGLPYKGKVPVVLDAAEEEKKRKRAERFGNAEANKKQKST